LDAFELTIARLGCREATCVVGALPPCTAGQLARRDSCVALRRHL